MCDDNDKNIKVMRKTLEDYIE